VVRPPAGPASQDSHGRLRTASSPIGSPRPPASPPPSQPLPRRLPHGPLGCHRLPHRQVASRALGRPKARPVRRRRTSASRHPALPPARTPPFSGRRSVPAAHRPLTSVRRPLVLPPIRRRRVRACCQRRAPPTVFPCRWFPGATCLAYLRLRRRARGRWRRVPTPCQGCCPGSRRSPRRLRRLRRPRRLLAGQNWPAAPRPIARWPTVTRCLWTGGC